MTRTFVFDKFMSINMLRSSYLTKNRYTVVYCQVCYMFCNRTLGLDDYMAKRKMIALQYKNVEDKFLGKMAEFADPSSKSLVFTEDFKHVIHLAKESDIEIVKNMMAKYSAQNSQLRFGRYIFGPVIMRLFHFLNKPLDALSIYNNEQFNSVFDNMSSHLILMDLLFKNDMYEEILRVYYALRNKQLLLGKYPKGIMVYVVASCYKLNSREHYDHVKKLWNEMVESGALPMIRTILIVSYLALKYDEPQFALDVIAQCHKTNEKIKSIKILAYLSLNKVDEAFQLLQSVLLVDNPYKKKEMFNKDVIAKVEEDILKGDTKELITKFNRVKDQLVTHGHIYDETFECYLFSRMTHEFTKTDDVVKASFSDQDYKRKFVRRQGLEDMI